MSTRRDKHLFLKMNGVAPKEKVDTPISKKKLISVAPNQKIKKSEERRGPRLPLKVARGLYIKNGVKRPRRRGPPPHPPGAGTEALRQLVAGAA
jgi:hypothetical protein